MSREITGVSVLPEAHFACQGTGMCCQGYQFGPIADDVAARIEAHPFPAPTAARLQAAGGAFTTAEVHGEPMRVLGRVAGRCVFLDDDGLCAVHKALGPTAKPALCQLYPLNVAVAPDGVAYVSLNMECGGFAAGRHGPPLAEAVEAHLDLIGAGPTLAVAESVAVRVGELHAYEVVFDDFEAPGLEDLDAPRDPLSLVADLCARLLTGEPHPEPFAHWPAQLPAALVRLAGRLAFYGRETAKAEAAAGDPVDAALHAELAAVAEGATRAAPDWALDADSQAILVTHLQQGLFGKALHRAPSLAAGLGAEALKLWLAAADPRPADAPALVARLRVLNRCLRPSDVDRVGPDFAQRCEALCEALAGQ